MKVTIVVMFSILVVPFCLHAATPSPPPRMVFSAGVGYDARAVRSHVDLLKLQREEIDFQRAGFTWRAYLADPKRVYPTPLVQAEGGVGVAGRGSSNTGRGKIFDTAVGVGAHTRINRWSYLTPMAGWQYQTLQYDRTDGRRDLAWKGLWVGLEGTIDGIPRWGLTLGAQFHWSDLEQEFGGVSQPSDPFTGLVFLGKGGYQVTESTDLTVNYRRSRWESEKGKGKHLELDSDLVGVNLDVRF